MRQSFSCPLWKSERETGPVMTKTSAGSNNSESNRAMTQTWSSLSQKCLNRSRTKVVRSEPTCFKLWFKVQTSQALGQRTWVMTGSDLGSPSKIWTWVSSGCGSVLGLPRLRTCPPDEIALGAPPHLRDPFPGWWPATPLRHCSPSAGVRLEQEEGQVAVAKWALMFIYFHARVMK